MQTVRMTVNLRAGESQESLLKRFRKEVVKARVLSTYRKKRWYISKSEQRRLAKQRAVRKARRKMMRRQFKQGGRQT
jgi:small subunit ribosomal protein S21